MNFLYNILTINRHKNPINATPAPGIRLYWHERGTFETHMGHVRERAPFGSHSLFIHYGTGESERRTRRKRGGDGITS